MRHVAIAGLLLALWLPSGRAAACSCSGFPTFATALRAHDVVFEGEVVRVQRTDDGTLARVRVLDVRRGGLRVRSVVRALSTRGPGTCSGPVLRRGRRLWIFASERPRGRAPFTLGACGLSGRLRPPSSAPAGSVGTVSINSQPWARVFVDGVDTGQRTPMRNLRLPPGRHVLRLVTQDGRSVERAIDVEAGSSARVLHRF